MPTVRRAAAALVLVCAFVLTATPAATDPQGGELAGFPIAHLPEQAHAPASPSDFTYEWGEVRFNSRVWEKRMEDGAARVVLQVLVMRGEKLTDLETVQDFLTEYHERSDDWTLDPFDNHGTPGLYTESEAFWVPEPQLAVEVRDPFGLIGPEEVLATARGVTTSPA